jgi:hypothetical protein
MNLDKAIQAANEGLTLQRKGGGTITGREGVVYSGTGSSKFEASDEDATAQDWEIVESPKNKKKTEAPKEDPAIAAAAKLQEEGSAEDKVQVKENANSEFEKSSAEMKEAAHKETVKNATPKADKAKPAVAKKAAPAKVATKTAKKK